MSASERVTFCRYMRGMATKKQAALILDGVEAILEKHDGLNDLSEIMKTDKLVATLVDTLSRTDRDERACTLLAGLLDISKASGVPSVARQR